MTHAKPTTKHPPDHLPADKAHDREHERAPATVDPNDPTTRVDAAGVAHGPHVTPETHAQPHAPPELHAGAVVDPAVGVAPAVPAAVPGAAPHAKEDNTEMRDGVRYIKGTDIVAGGPTQQ